MHVLSIWVAICILKRHGTAVDLFREARVRGVITSLDPQFPLAAMQGIWLPALDDLLPLVDFLFCDADEPLCLTGESDVARAADVLLDAGARHVVVKCGAAGAAIYAGSQQFAQEAFLPDALTDTVGAGDVYDAGFLYGLLQGWGLPRCALFACIAAGFSAASVGSTIPDLPVLLAELAKH